MKRMLPLKDSFKKSLSAFVVCWFAYALAYFCRQNMVIALPFLRSEFGYSQAALGFIGSAFYWIYAMGQLFNGLWGDRYQFRKVAFIGLLFSGIVNILFGFFSSFVPMILLWGLNGFFQSLLWVCIVKTSVYECSGMRPNPRATILHASSVAGYILSFFILGKLSEVLSWRWFFFLPGIVLCVHAMIWYSRIVKKPSCKETDVSHQNSLSLFAFLKKIWVYILIAFPLGFIREGIAFWSPFFLSEKYDISTSRSATWAILIPIANFFGILLAGFLYSRFKNGKKVLFFLFFLSGVIATVLYTTELPLSGCVAAISLLSGCMFGVTNVLFSIVPIGYVKYGKVAAVAGILDFFTYVSAGVSGPITGWLSASLGFGGVFGIWVICAFGGALVSLIYLFFQKTAKTSVLGTAS